jgi:hypothetical protein
LLRAHQQTVNGTIAWRDEGILFCVGELRMLLLKLLLIACTVYLSSLAARRGGHALAGLVTGMPMIVGPILGLVLIDHGPAVTERVTWATITCFPATLLHALVFSVAARRFSWPVCLLLATVCFLLAAAGLSWLALPRGWAAVLAAASPSLTVLLMSRSNLSLDSPQTSARVSVAPAAVQIPTSEVFFRIAAAVAMAAAIIVGADHFPSFVSGLLLAIPIAGAVLPCFTLPRYGHLATEKLLIGFAKGLNGFCAFCIALAVLLVHVHPAIAFFLALCTAAATARVIARRA